MADVRFSFAVGMVAVFLCADSAFAAHRFGRPHGRESIVPVPISTRPELHEARTDRAHEWYGGLNLGLSLAANAVALTGIVFHMVDLAKPSNSTLSLPRHELVVIGASAALLAGPISHFVYGEWRHAFASFAVRLVGTAAGAVLGIPLSWAVASAARIRDDAWGLGATVTGALIGAAVAGIAAEWIDILHLSTRSKTSQQGAQLFAAPAKGGIVAGISLRF